MPHSLPSSERSPASARTLPFLALAAATLLATAPLSAADVTLRLQGQAVTTSANVVGLTDDLGSGPGIYLGAEFSLNERFGIEVGVGWTEFEESETSELLTGIDFSTAASLTINPVTVALDIHLTPQKRYDLYVAPKIGWAFIDDLEVFTEVDFGDFPIPGIPTLPTFNQTVFAEIPTDDQFIFGLRLGFDIPFGDGAWSFSSSLDYTDIDLDVDLPPASGRGGRALDAPSVGLDPFSIGAGVAYSF